MSLLNRLLVAEFRRRSNFTVCVHSKWLVQIKQILCGLLGFAVAEQSLSISDELLVGTCYWLLAIGDMEELAWHRRSTDNDDNVVASGLQGMNGKTVACTNQTVPIHLKHNGQFTV